MVKHSLIKTWVFFLAILTGAFSYALSTGAEKNPKLSVSEKSWDFGEIKQGDVLTHIFKFKNEGGAPLEIFNVRASCGCTAVILSKKIIPPGEEGTLKVTFNSRGYSDKVRKYIFLDTNDPDREKFQIFVEADIEVPPRPRIALEQYTADVGLVIEKEKIRHAFKVKNIGERELSFSCLHRQAEFMVNGEKNSFPVKVSPGRDVEVFIDIGRAEKPGIFRDSILIKSNDPMRPNISLFLSGYVVTLEQLEDLCSRGKKHPL
ncbi:MAG: DUF1573 domain-containing protein [Candidatus Aminicenantes bacterium]|nr:DUF1573 domain-containing protein [Candidatus Aminicenantes bacterium]